MCDSSVKELQLPCWATLVKRLALWAFLGDDGPRCLPVARTTGSLGTAVWLAVQVEWVDLTQGTTQGPNPCLMHCRRASRLAGGSLIKSLKVQSQMQNAMESSMAASGIELQPWAPPRHRATDLCLESIIVPSTSVTTTLTSFAAGPTAAGLAVPPAVPAHTFCPPF